MNTARYNKSLITDYKDISVHINVKSNDVFEEFVTQKSTYITKYKG